MTSWESIKEIWTDQRIKELFRLRFKVVQQVWIFKKAKNMPVVYMSRWEKVVLDRIAKGEQRWLNKKIIEEIWEKIHCIACEIEKDISLEESLWELPESLEKYREEIDRIDTQLIEELANIYQENLGDIISSISDRVIALMDQIDTKSLLIS